MVEKIEEIEKKFDAKEKKNKKGIITIVIILLILLIIAGSLFTLYKINSKPKAILRRLVSKIAIEDNYSKIETLKTNYEVYFSINTDNKQAQLGFNELSKCYFKSNVQTDLKNKKEIVNLGLMYDDQEIIGSKLVYNNDNFYTFFNEIYDKYIQIELDSNTKEAVDSIFDATSKNDNKDIANEVISIIKDILNEKIEKSEAVTQEEVVINVNDKEKNVKKTSIKLTAKELTNMLSDTYIKIADSKIYLNKEDEKNAIKEVAKEIKETEFGENDYVVISIYTGGIRNSFEGFKISIYVEENKFDLNFELIKNDKNLYKYSVYGKGQGSYFTFATGEIKYNKEVDNDKLKKGDFAISISVPEIVTNSTNINMEVKVKYDVSVNSKIDEIDTSNNIPFEELTTKDYELMIEKLKEKPIIGPIISSYELLKEYNENETLNDDDWFLDTDDTFNDDLIFNFDFDSNL